MFHKRRSSKKLDIELYAEFRTNHPDVRPGTTAPIHLSAIESERINETGCKGDADAQYCDSSTSGVPRHSSGRDYSVTQTPFKTDIYVFAQQHKAEGYSQLTEEGPSQPTSATSEHDMWSDFILAEHLSPSGPFPSRTFQDFPSFLTPQTSVPETGSSASSGTRCLPPLASEDTVGPNCGDFIGPYQYNSVDTPCQEMESTESVHSSNSTRFKCRLDAPPALMLKGSGGSPVTYLNKGSQYSIVVEDTLSAESSPGTKVYRTSVQVGFDTEQQRQHPLVYWQMWEQNRDDEVRSVDGKSRAIEYVGAQESDHQDNMANLSAVHSDGFSLLWSVDPTEKRQLCIAIRLNFRSTDFSHNKGVIGSPMRLSCRTDEISTNSMESLVPSLEMNFCRIKSFRSHGAERKNANDLAIRKKRIKRLKQQLAQSQTNEAPEDNTLDCGKSKVPMARRTREDGLLCKLKNLQRDCILPQLYTSFDYRGVKQQDCDWSPLGHKDKSPESLGARPTVLDPDPQSSTISKTSQPIHCPDSSMCSEWHERISSQSISSRMENISLRRAGSKVACFYIRPVGFRHISQDDHYRAVYLSERTASELTLRLAQAVSVDPGKVGQTTWSTVKGLTVLVDDDVVANMVEGQDMQVEAKYAAPSSLDEKCSAIDRADDAPCREHGVSHGSQLLQLNLLF